MRFDENAGPDSLEQIWSIRLDTGDRELLAFGGAPAWSPDDRRLAFERHGDIFILDLATRAMLRLTQVGACFNPAWKPDGSRVAYDLLPNGSTVTAADAGIWSSSSGGGGARIRVVGEGARYPAWSRDGDSLACSVPFASSYELCIFDLKTDSLSRITNDVTHDQGPCWSPRGNTIAWARRGPMTPSGAAVYGLDLQGGTRTLLDSMSVHPTWNPDASEIAVEGLDEATFSMVIFRKNLATGARTRLTTDLP